jgi:glucose dehydrogenase
LALFDCKLLDPSAQCSFLPGEALEAVSEGVEIRAFLFGATLAVRAQVTDQELLKPDPNDWLAYSGTYNSHRHSQLKQITAQNVRSLQARWVYQLVGQQHVQAVPVVADGVMYVSQFNRVDALDARTGSSIICVHQRAGQHGRAARHRRPR